MKRSKNQREPSSEELAIFNDGVKYLNDEFNNNVWDLFQYIRGEIKHEHALLMGRVT